MELKQELLPVLKDFDKLLIVPYGIETTFPVILNLDYQPFNRTLWN